MLDFETPTYVTAKEAQHMQSAVNRHYIVSTQYLAVGSNNHFTLQFSVSLMLRREHGTLNCFCLTMYLYCISGVVFGDSVDLCVLHNYYNVCELYFPYV